MASPGGDRPGDTVTGTADGGSTRMRIAVGITVPGAALIIAGLLAGSAGEVIRLAGHRGWQPLANAATVLVTGAMLCGVMLLAVVGWWWGLTWRNRPQAGRDLASGPGWPPVHPFAVGPGGPAGPAAAPAATGVSAGGPGHGTADADPSGGGPSGGDLSGGDLSGGGPSGRGPARADPSGGGPAEQKLVELRDLYRAAGEMSDAALRESWDELTRRQEELIRGYFEASKRFPGKRVT